MDKKTYYITLHTGFTTGEIREEKNDASYDYAIEASPEEAYQLHRYFEEASGSDFWGYLHSHISLTNVLMDRDNDQYDRNLVEIYRMIYNLGTPQTKQQIEDMGISKIFNNPASNPLI
jgi:hypothetical protein